MPHLAITVFLKSAFRKAVADIETTIPVTKSTQNSRRRFLQDTGIIGAGMMMLPSFLQAVDFNSNKKIAIIGAGIAGLNAAYQLQKLGLQSTLYEAGKRTGGRMYTMKNYFGDNITTDIGGEFVDTNHEEIIELVKELQLDFYDLRTEQLINKSIYFDGKNYTEEMLGEVLKPFAAKIEKDIRSLPDTINYTTAPAFEKLDQQSIAGYLKQLGIDGWLYDFIYTVLTREYGMEASQQSAINFLIMFDAPKVTNTKYELFGSDHEVFKIKGGSQHLTDTLTKKVQKNIRLQHQLQSITQDKNGISLTFNNQGKKLILPADHVIMTLPFSVLRKIDLNIEMPAQKKRCIDELGYGNSCKFIMGFKDKPWRTAGKQGYTFTDEAFGCGWDSSQMQSEKEGSFTVFGGGDFGDEMLTQQQEKLSNNYVKALDNIYPGSSGNYTGKNIKFCWQKSPVAKAGYSCFTTGQWSTLAGWEAIPVGNIHFAGEHTSLAFQGYMNGAAISGKNAATQIAANILKMKNPHNNKQVT
ncbi:NAD(P)/FAD-dependent oxidoreductase [Ferruginibacter sp.]|uniref:flavin monoamine oxidase family protein n=1 Tax=Ferruginibacter sp. TaxID=1940288 RepID=UPI002657CC30|nr:NAD(P)/FAD-dependent oxidoreductase [Ferruginibacter sp.]